MTELVFTDVFQSISTGLLLRQFQGKPRITGLLSSFSSEGQAFYGVLEDLLTKRTLDAAVGAQLDGIGDILGLTRGIGLIYANYFGFVDQPTALTFGEAPIRDVNQGLATSTKLDDNTYRSLLRLKIILNTAHGTLDDILSALKTSFFLSAYTIQTTGPAEVAVTLTPTANTPPVLWANVLQYLPVAAGVTVKLTLNNGG